MQRRKWRSIDGADDKFVGKQQNASAYEKRLDAAVGPYKAIVTEILRIAKFPDKYPIATSMYFKVLVDMAREAERRNTNAGEGDGFNS